MGVKVVKDLVHSYIEIDETLQAIIDTASFQRLRRIKQLSCSYIFPSTNHTRYEHSLGVMQLACDFFNVLEKDFKKHNLTDEEIGYLKIHIRLAALLHDIGHPPFSHLGEKFLDKNEIYESIKEYSHLINTEKTFFNSQGELIGKEHELLSCYCILRKFYDILKKLNEDIDIEFICRCIIGNVYEEKENWYRNICVRILNSDSIDVDKLDYLMRDNHMTGEIAPKMDIKRLLACLTISENTKELKYVAKAIPAVQSVVDSRDLLYLWVYHHHISIYTDYVTGKILKKCMELFENERGVYQEELDRKNYFSPKAITDYLITDDDVYSHLRKVYINSLEEKAHSFNKIASKQLFERNFLKSLWKTIYEYKDFENYLLEKGIVKSYEKLTEILKNEKNIEKITKKIQESLNLKEGEVFIITKYNKFYNSTKEAPISLLLNGENRKLSELLPQKSFEKFHTMSFFVFVTSAYKNKAKKFLIEEFRKINKE